MPLVEHDDVVEALSPNRADEAIYIRILPWRLVGRNDLLDAKRPYPDVTATDGNGIAVDMITVIVTYQLATAAPSVGPGALFALHQNQPNPFNPRTVIHYDLSSDGLRSSLRIYDLRGSLVRTLVDEPQFAGSRSVSWNGRDESGRAVASGVYFYRLTVGTESQTKRLMLLK